ncbi:MAG: class II fructose-bisphosphate aldolase [Lachnospiraceae bacterium]
MLVSTKDMLVKAKEGKYAVANFCIWNVEMLSGVMEACEELRSPVILSFGSGFLQNTDINHFIHMMRSYATTTPLPASIHWDHGRSYDIVSHAIDIGYNSLMIDGSAYDFEENIRMTKEVVDKFQPMGIPIEAELGHVGAETDYEEALASYGYTDPSQAAEFVERTGIDSLAVAIGNQHGAYSAPPQINFEILQAVADAVSIPLVLHGASGISDEDVRKSIGMGITKVNIHTELCEAALIAIDANYEKKASYLALNQEVRAEVKKRAMEKIRLFGSDGKADGWFAE